MADITRYPITRHLRGTPTAARAPYAPRQGRACRHRAVVLLPAAVGRAVRGAGRRPRAGGAVPRQDRRLPGPDGAGQRDVPGHRSRDRLRADRLLDRPGRPAPGAATPLEQLAGLLTETAQQQVLGLIAASPLAAVLADGVGAGARPDPDRPDWRRPAGRDRHRGDRRPGRRHPAGAGRREGAAHAGPRADPAGGRPGDLRAPRRRGPARAGNRRERAGRTRSSSPGARPS